MWVSRHCWHAWFYLDWSVFLLNLFKETDMRESVPSCMCVCPLVCLSHLMICFRRGHVFLGAFLFFKNTEKILSGPFSLLLLIHFGRCFPFICSVVKTKMFGHGVVFHIGQYSKCPKISQNFIEIWMTMNCP